MGFFGKLWNVVDPFVPDEAVRGVGRIARGKFSEGFGDIKHGVGDSLRGVGMAGSFIPGVGPGIAAAATAGSKLLHGEDFGDALGSGIKSYALGKLGSAIKGRLFGSGGGGAPGVPETPDLGQAYSVAPGSVTEGGVRGFDLLPKAIPDGGGGSALGGAIRSAVSGAGDAVSRVSGSISDTWGQLEPSQKFALGLQGVGTAAQAYGAKRMGDIEDRRLGMQEEDRRRRHRSQDAVNPIRAALLRRLMAGA